MGISTICYCKVAILLYNTYVSRSDYQASDDYIIIGLSVVHVRYCYVIYVKVYVIYVATTIIINWPSLGSNA